MTELEEYISAARGEMEVDLLLEGARLLNTLSGEVYSSPVAVHGERVVGFDAPSAQEVVELEDAVLAPGFIDGHVHLESSMVTVPEYARAVVPRGTTAVVADPHEIANVMGLEGIRYIMDSSQRLPLSVFILLPSCVPATPLETSGAVLGVEDLRSLLGSPQVLGLAEVMNYPGVISRDPQVMAKIRMARGMTIDGHAPLIHGRDLWAYVTAGIGSDHECTTAEEAQEKLRAGMHIMIREGTAARNLEDLIPLVNPINGRRFMFASDDRHASDLQREGHLDFMIVKAVSLGLDPILALQMATINPAGYFGLTDRGAIAPGYRADMVVLDNLDNLRTVMVFTAGKLVARDGSMTVPIAQPPDIRDSTMNPGPLSGDSFELEARGRLALMIGIIPNQIITRKLTLPISAVNGLVVADPERDIAKLAVVERHKKTGNVGLGLVQGLGLQRGAIATSVAHDSHNLIVAGVSSREMYLAAMAVIEMGGGMAVVDGPEVTASLPLPIAGLISKNPMNEVAEKIQDLVRAAQKLGSPLEDPFMTLSFLALPVIPELKLTDRGLVDVGAFSFVPLFPSEGAHGT